MQIESACNPSTASTTNMHPYSPCYMCVSTHRTTPRQWIRREGGQRGAGDTSRWG
jgi:hypothetical protein